ncbi:MAG: hypothetical protein KDE31_34300 [Caldilineaceae bacterium]|nr:hypothetical protein [Caldilineaceae bacterium]
MSDSNLTPATQEENFLTKLMQETMQTMTHADEEEALTRVQTLRQKFPQATTDELAEKLIRHKCIQAGAIGAVTASPTMIPGLGTVVALTFGTAVDIRMMYKLQGELVLELINLYAPTLALENKRNVLMVVTGISIGANRVLSEGGQELAAKATQRLSVRLGGTVAEEVAEDATIGIFAKSVSTVLGVATAAGINMVTTYTIGRRAQAYLKQGPEAMEDWTTSMRAITGVDERKLLAWLMEATRNSWQEVRRHSTDWVGKIGEAGQSAKEIYVIQASKTGETVLEAGSFLTEQSSAGMTRLVDLGKSTSNGLIAGAGALVNGVVDKFKGNDQVDQEQHDEATEIILAPAEVPIAPAEPPRPLATPDQEADVKV